MKFPYKRLQHSLVFINRFHLHIRNTFNVFVHSFLVSFVILQWIICYFVPQLNLTNLLSINNTPAIQLLYDTMKFSLLYLSSLLNINKNKQMHLHYFDFKIIVEVCTSYYLIAKYTFAIGKRIKAHTSSTHLKF